MSVGPHTHPARLSYLWSAPQQKRYLLDRGWRETRDTGIWLSPWGSRAIDAEFACAAQVTHDCERFAKQAS